MSQEKKPKAINFKGLKNVQNTITRTGKVPLLFLFVRKSHSAANQERDPLYIKYRDNSRGRKDSVLCCSEFTLLICSSSLK